jgi:hypothetical protein
MFPAHAQRQSFCGVADEVVAQQRSDGFPIAARERAV